jgi:hypothetical protein
MNMRVRFTVKGRPPKKHGEKSMWARNDEAPRIASLREKALETRTKLGINDCFHSLVSLELRIFVPKSRIESIGDLDNFITGVCDGLQAADSKVLPYLHRIFSEPGREGIDPKKALVIENDSKVVSILAKKIELDEDKEEFYDVVVETDQAVLPKSMRSTKLP